MATLFGLVVLFAGILLMVGLAKDEPVMIGAGFLLMALCAIFGVQPGWPPKSTPD